MALTSTFQHQRPFPPSPVYQVACDALRSGISLVPIRPNASKQPAVAWRTYQRRYPTFNELDNWFRLPGPGLALITGEISGGLEALDFDSRVVWEAWLKRIQRHAPLAALYAAISSGYEEQTPSGGRHLLYRCEVIEGNKRLACRPIDPPQRVQTLIETRGEGGILIIDPSSGRVHESGRPYLRLHGSVRSIVQITPAQRSLLLASAQWFDEMPKPAQVSASSHHASSPRNARFSSDARPGDVFNARARWEDVLKPAGWVLVSESGRSEQFWRRPGKSEGVSATTNYGNKNRLRVFSTSTPFDTTRTYSLFEAYALLWHNEDFAAAARELAQLGYNGR